MLVVDEVGGAVGAEGLLVGHGQVDERAVWPEARLRQPLRGDGHRGGEVQHVDRASTPHLRAPVLVVDEFTAERISLPSFDVDRNNIGVTHQQQRRRGGIAAFDASDEIAASGYRFVRFDV